MYELGDAVAPRSDVVEIVSSTTFSDSTECSWNLVWWNVINELTTNGYGTTLILLIESVRITKCRRIVQISKTILPNSVSSMILIVTHYREDVNANLNLYI